MIAAPAIVASTQSIPLLDVVAEMLSESDNMTAETLLKNVGVAGSGSGSTASGAAALRRSLALGGATEKELAALKMDDGSGLSRDDRASCRLLLGAIRDQPLDGPLVKGLAVMGESGTLKERLRNSPARGKVLAKTGTLNGVSALVGLARGDDGVTRRFALVLNGLTSGADGLRTGDALAELLVTAVGGPDPSVLAPRP
jgi:D-alanyl-D-alanine carboxypeptidase/D-alanyl-D-alanine-endopeptidase (penicillin-binding protein 4)